MALSSSDAAVRPEAFVLPAGAFGAPARPRGSTPAVHRPSRLRSRRRRAPGPSSSARSRLVTSSSSRKPVHSQRRPLRGRSAQWVIYPVAHGGQRRLLPVRRWRPRGSADRVAGQLRRSRRRTPAGRPGLGPAARYDRLAIPGRHQLVVPVLGELPQPAHVDEHLPVPVIVRIAETDRPRRDRGRGRGTPISVRGHRGAPGSRAGAQPRPAPSPRLPRGLRRRTAPSTVRRC